ncbi:MAG: pyridoxamine 5'-phosphate oxidase family protein [Deltaproteobacteria bacterium]|nr:pyridoxamine 5'-phosphate oxidase family protein [Deltaproteobacteria bacterium]
MKTETPPPSQEELRKLAEELIREQNTMTLSTAIKDAAWAAPVYYAHLAFKLYFFSDPGSRHIQEALASRQAAAAIFHPSSTWKEIRGIQMSGALHPVSIGLESVRALRAYLKKFPFTHDFFDSGETLDLDGFAKRFRVRLYRFQPDLFYYMDNRIRFGFREIIKL